MRLARQCWHVAQDSSGALVQLIDDGLDLARFETGRVRLQPAPVKLAPLLARLIEQYRLDADHRGLALHLHLAPGLPEQVSLDAMRLRQLLAKLIGNALNCTRQGGVTVRVGPGVAPGVDISNARLGQPAVSQAAAPAGAERRTGLGLAICKRLALAMHGHLTVTSAAGVGTEVRLVDDDGVSRLLLAEMLRRAGCAVVEAEGAEQALACWRSQDLAAVISHRHMPGMDGPSLLRLISAEAAACAGLTIAAMSIGEFDLIRKYFTRPAPGGAAPAVLGIGDDCALLQPTPGMQWAVSSDMLVEGRHFLPTVLPERLGHKALAVNLSDLAACGAKPVAYTLALALPRVDEGFLAGLARGLFALGDAHGIELVGGDTTAGPLNLCITVIGEVPPGQALRRDGARPGDALWVSHARSGGLGDARLALDVFRGQLSLPGEQFERVRRAMELPQPRVALGLALRGLATAAIDLSDGLVGDLAHLLARSAVGAVIDVDQLPISQVLAGQPLARQREYALAGGDDYELLFTAPAQARARVLAAGLAAGVALRCIGRIDAGSGWRLVDGAGGAVALPLRGFDHFSAAD